MVTCQTSENKTDGQSGRANDEKVGNDRATNILIDHVYIAVV